MGANCPLTSDPSQLLKSPYAARSNKLSRFGFIRLRGHDVTARAIDGPLRRDRATLLQAIRAHRARARRTHSAAPTGVIKRLPSNRKKSPDSCRCRHGTRLWIARLQV